MINRIIDFSVENKFIVIALVAVACVAGWWSMRHVPLDAIPDLSDTQVIVFSRWDRSPDLGRRPGDLSDRLGPGGCAPRSGPCAGSRTSATPTSTSSSRTAPTSTGRARAPRSTSRPCCRACPRASGPSSARMRPRSAGSSSTRWSTSRAGAAWLSCAHSRTGISSTISNPFPAWPRWRRSAGSANSTRSTSTRTGCRPMGFRSTRSSRRCGRATTSPRGG